MLIKYVLVSIYIGMVALGASPRQESVPPQPFYADFYSGTVSIDDLIGDGNVNLFACVLNCERFQTDSILINLNEGSYTGLKISPTDKKLLYQEVTFYLDNGVGMVKAEETSLMEGAFIRKIVDLTFEGPFPIEQSQEPVEAEKLIEPSRTSVISDGAELKSSPAPPEVGGKYNLYWIWAMGLLGVILVGSGLLIGYRVFEPYSKSD